MKRKALVKTRKLTFYLPLSTLKKLDRIVKAMSMASQTEAIRRSIEHYFEECTEK